MIDDAAHEAFMTRSRLIHFYAIAENAARWAALATENGLCYGDAAGFGRKRLTILAMDKKCALP